MARKYFEGERRESRVSLIVIPSLYRDVATLADSQGVSINELVVRLLEKTVDKNSELINRFRQARDSARSDFADVD